MPPETDGQWMGAQLTPGEHHTGGAGVFVIHATLLRTGKVLIFSGHTEGVHYLAESWIWDPATSVTTAQRQAFPGGIDIFCCHHANLDDGRVITVGGSAPSPDDGKGIKAICVIDPSAATPAWTKIGEMSHGRWYPTLVTLHDGRLVAFSGHREVGVSGISPTVELFNPPFQGPGYTTVTLAGGDKIFPTYPGLYLTRGGRIFHTGITWRYEDPVAAPIGTFSFRVTSPTTGAWTDHGTSPHVPLREEGTSVILPPAQDGKLLLIGGAKANGHPASALVAGSEARAAEILDTQSSPPSWRRIADMTHPRINVSCVLLPDGRVLVLGGHNFYKWDASSANSNQAEIYDPVLDNWTAVASMSESRTYHSAALLLPDGRVFVAGGVDPTQNEPGHPGNRLNRKTFEMYHPPYFFNGTRPQLTNATGTDVPGGQIAYGGELTIDVDVAATNIRKVALMRLGAMTHHTDTEQRYVPLDFVVGGANRVRAAVIGDPSVAPPGYYMLWVVDNMNRPCQQASVIRLMRQQCYVIIDKSHYSADEVGTTATDFPESFYVVMDGFTPEELGITTPPPPDLTPIAPVVAFEKPDGTAITAMSAAPTQVLMQVNPPPVGVRQRFAFKYTLTFANRTIFFQSDGTTPIEAQQARLRATKNGFTGRGEVSLFHLQNPYMIDGDPAWLSVDLRVFKISQGGGLFGRNVGASPAEALVFIRNVLTDFNANPAAARTQFESTIPTGQDTPLTRLDILESRGGQRIFNFAIAQVRYRGRALTANDVRVFFRLFTTAATGMDFRPDTYPTVPNTSGEPIPLLGLQGGEVGSIPFFAEARVNTSFQRMDEQRDDINRHTLAPDAAGNEVTAYYGCWLDFNQLALRYPMYPGNNVGPWSSGLESLQQRIRGRHQCLVAEVHFPSGDPIGLGATPGGHDNLSQRNLAIDESDNPGGPMSHIVQHTFEMKPSAVRTAPAAATLVTESAQQQLLLGDGYDELLILWNNLPRESRVTLYLPDCDIDEILEIAATSTGPQRLEKIDDATILCHPGDVTFVPVPGGRATNIPGLITIQLPDGIRAKQEFRVVVRQYDGVTRAIIGTFELRIPVRHAPEILGEQEETLAVMKYIASGIPPANRWYRVFNRYVDQLGGKVRALGGDPDAVLPSPDDSGVPGRDGHGDQKRCCTLFWIDALLLAFSIALLGFARLGGVAAAGWTLFAILFVIFTVVWTRRCRPDACKLLTMLLTGGLLGAAFLGLLTLAGFSPPVAGGVFVLLLLILALIAVALVAKRCMGC